MAVQSRVLAEVSAHVRRATEQGGSPVRVKKLAMYERTGQISNYIKINESQVSQMSEKGVVNMKTGTANKP